MPQQTLESRIESSLLYTGDDGKQHFVHDGYRDFFLAKWFAEDKKNIDKFWQKVLSSNQEGTYGLDIEWEIIGFWPGSFYEKRSSFSPLTLCYNSILFYCEMVPNADYIIESALNLTDDIGPYSYDAGVIGEGLLGLMERISGFISSDTIDRFILFALKHRPDHFGGIGPSINIVPFILDIGKDPLPYFMKEHDCDESKALRLLGETYRYMLLQEEAIECIEKSIEIGPATTDDYLLLGDLYMQLGKFGEAIVAFRRGKGLENGDLSDLFDKGIAMAKSKKLSDPFWLE